MIGKVRFRRAATFTSGLLMLGMSVACDDWPDVQDDELPVLLLLDSIDVGQSTRLVYVWHDETTQPESDRIDLEDTTGSWSSSHPDVAMSLGGGWFRAVAPGTATLRVVKPGAVGTARLTVRDHASGSSVLGSARLTGTGPAEMPTTWSCGPGVLNGAGFTDGDGRFAFDVRYPTSLAVHLTDGDRIHCSVRIRDLLVHEHAAYVEQSRQLLALAPVELEPTGTPSAIDVTPLFRQLDPFLVAASLQDTLVSVGVGDTVHVLISAPGTSCSVVIATSDSATARPVGHLGVLGVSPGTIPIFTHRSRCANDTTGVFGLYVHD